MTDMIDLITLADRIATTSEKAQKLQVGARQLFNSDHLAKKFPILSKVKNVDLIAIGRSNEGIYGITCQLWHVDDKPTIVQPNNVDIATERITIKSVKIAKKIGIGDVTIDNVDFKITVNLTDDCILEYGSLDGKLVDLDLKLLSKSLKEKPDNFVKVTDETIPLNVNIKIVAISGTTKKYNAPVYKVCYTDEKNKKVVIERLLPNARLRYLIDNGTVDFFVAKRYEKTDNQGQIKKIAKIFDSNEPNIDDLEWD